MVPRRLRAQAHANAVRNAYRQHGRAGFSRVAPLGVLAARRAYGSGFLPTRAARVARRVTTVRRQTGSNTTLGRLNAHAIQHVARQGRRILRHRQLIRPGSFYRRR